MVLHRKLEPFVSDTAPAGLVRIIWYTAYLVGYVTDMNIYIKFDLYLVPICTLKISKLFIISDLHMQHQNMLFRLSVTHYVLR
jgi:hypothetical protein